MTAIPNCESAVLLKQLATEYATIFNIETVPERQKITNQIEGALAQIEQHNVLLDEAAGLNTEMLEKQLPKIYAHYQALQDQFRSVDALSSLVARVSEDVGRLEGAVTAAEQQLLGQQQPLQHRILQPVIRKLDPVISNGSYQTAAFDPSLLFNPADYLKSDHDRSRIIYNSPAVSQQAESSGYISSAVRGLRGDTLVELAQEASSLITVPQSFNNENIRSSNSLCSTDCETDDLILHDTASFQIQHDNCEMNS